MKKIDEIYQIQLTYKRYSTRIAAARRRERPPQRDSRRAAWRGETRLSNIRGGKPGFSLLDYAFYDGAFTIGHATGSGRGNWNRGLYSWSPLGASIKPPDVEKFKADPKRASKIIKKAARYYGAALVGICELDERWIYAHDYRGREIVFEDVEEWYETEEKIVIPESHKYIIVPAVPMEFEEIKYAPMPMTPVSTMGYSRMAIVAGSLAEFIRGLGWHALPCGNDTGLSVPLAIEAGLGHAGRNGRLITWERGPMVRLCKVFTDLPLEPDETLDDGIIKFCEVCKKCARMCPTQALPMGERTFEGPSPSNNPGVLKWYEDGEKCSQFWNQVGSGCSLCFRVCPFTKPNTGLHRLVKWFIRNVPALNRFWVWCDDFFGYGKMGDPEKYWES